MTQGFLFRSGRSPIIAAAAMGWLMAAATFAAPAPERLAAFPGAEGFGAFSLGGRGGMVFHVTNLNDAGPGSLREAVETSGPRTVVFDVSGTIRLASSLVVRRPRLTIAGQTAPGDGICLRDASLAIDAGDVVVRFLRCRLGDQGRTGDAISINRGRNIIVDHCSASWSTDELISASTGRPDLSEVTVQWCFLTEALNAGNHGYGSLIRGTGGARYTYHHNLYAHNRGRNPRPGNYISRERDPEGLLLDFRNNVIYNFGGGYAGYNADTESITHLNYIGNVVIPGADTSAKWCAYRIGSPYNRAFFRDTLMNGGTPEDPWSVVNFENWTAGQIAAYKQPRPFEAGRIATDTTSETLRRVLADGGATRPRRDTVDARIVRGVVGRTGSKINSQEDVFGWPELQSEPAPVDTDADGMPDAWERRHGLDPANPADGARDRDGDGYTNLEDYLNDLARVER